VAGGGWAERETRLLWRRVLKRLDLTARTIIAAVEPDSCFAGTLAELALAADRSFMLDDPSRPTELVLTEANEGWYPMANGLSRLGTRFLDGPLPSAGRYDPAKAAAAGLVTFTPDDIDWDDELRLAVEERAAMSPDALTGLEANCRFPGPETMETKIFARLSAWQNWIFIRPNASGEQGALRRYGTGARPEYDFRRT
jgi:benzoyl-CoA-dihydrodiol lyase